MQGTKVVIWLVAVSLGATALMFGIASLIRAGGESSSDTVVVNEVQEDRTTQIRRTTYVRVCKLNEWDDLDHLLRYARMTGGLMENSGNVTPTTLAYLSEQLAIAKVLAGESWRDMYPLQWPDGSVPPTRRELAETTKWCIKTLTPKAQAWLLLAGVKPLG